MSSESENNAVFNKQKLISGLYSEIKKKKTNFSQQKQRNQQKEKEKKNERNNWSKIMVKCNKKLF